MYHSACQMIVSGLPELDGFDPELGLKLHGGSVDGYYAALCAFADALPEFRDGLLNGRFSGAGALSRETHRLRISANTVGAYIISRLAEVLETAVEERRTELFRSSVRALLKHCDTFNDTVGDYLRAFSPAADKQSATGPQLKGYFQKLRSCAEDFDLAGAEEIVSALDAFSFPSAHISELFEQIKQSVDDVNYNFFGDLSETCCAMCGGEDEDLRA